MSSDREHQIWALALAAEHDHGDAADKYARSQSAHAAIAGDDGEAELWDDVAALLHKLHSIGQPLKSIGRAELRPL